MERSRPGEIVAALVFPLLFIVILLIALAERDLLGRVLASPEAFRSWVESYRYAPFVFIAIQFLQVLIFVIPGEVPQIAGGYLFGAPLGLLYSLTGIVAGSLVNFLIGRWFGTPFVTLVVGRERYERFAHLLASRRVLTVFFLFFLFPGFPKDALCYVAGLSGIRFLPFFVITLFGRLPALVTSVLAGSAAAGGRWVLLVVLSVLVALAAGFGVLYRRPLREWVERIGRDR